MQAGAAKKDAPVVKKTERKEAAEQTGIAGKKAKSGVEDREKKDAQPEGDLYTFEEPTVEEQSYAWGIVKMIIVLGLMVGGFYYFFRYVSRARGGPMGGNIAQVLSLIPVGQNKFIQIIDLAGKVLVLGVTDHAINLIMEIKDRDEIDRIRLAGSKVAAVRPGGFQEFLTGQVKKFLRRGENTRGEYRQYAHRDDDAEIDRLDYLALQKERLKKLNGMDNE